MLRERAEQFVGAESEGDLVTRLATAGERALDAAVASGEDRAAALDLLAADTLITLALLAQAEIDPAALGSAARRLRGMGPA